MTQFRIFQPINYPSSGFTGEVQEVSGLLRDIQQNHQPEIVSFSQKIDRIDPLDLLETISDSKQLYFYWENPRQSEAIIAYGTTKCLKLNSSNRFSRSQQFINNCLAEMVTIGDLQLPGSGPHFFCSFTFFLVVRLL
jgi:menaquinone-specific isochorismate synthase